MSISDAAFNGQVGLTKTFRPKIGKHRSLFHKYEKIDGRMNDLCSVDIIIPFHGQYDKVRRVLSSVLHKTRSNPILVTLVDDGSPNLEFLETISQAPRTQCIRLEQQSGFGNALRIGYENTEQPYICFLNSDCVIHNGSWLEELGGALLAMKEKDVRLVSARSDNPMSNIPELKADRTDDEIGNIVVDSPLPLYCTMCHRELFNHIGGFIKPYPYGWYEDEELFWRMRKHGFHQGIAGRSWVHHEGEATIRHLWKKNPDIKKIMLENKERCLKDIRALHLNETTST